MATQLSILNRVMRRLREDQVTSSIDTEYATLVSEFVKDAYEEIIEEDYWQNLFHEIEFDVVPGQTVYNLSAFQGSGGDVRLTSTRLAKIDSTLEVEGNLGSLRFYTDDTDPVGRVSTYVTPETLWNIEQGNRNITNQWPGWFTLVISEDNTTLLLKLWSTPTDSRYGKIRLYTEPDRLELDGSTDAVSLLVPDRPVYHLALLNAYNERGEEIGEPGNVAETRYLNSLGAAKEENLRVKQRTNTYDWYRD